VAHDAGVHVWLARHGETEWSLSGQHTGRTEIELTARGRAQAAALRPIFARLQPSYVLCSPRVRARQTAELAGLVVDAIDDDLAEWDYGDYEGLTSAQIREFDPTPGGETAAQVAERADRALERTRKHVARGPVVLVAHGHISRMLGVRWIALPPSSGASLAMDTASTSVLGVENGSPVLAHWNVAPIPSTDIARPPI
jgi:broad specificity phosphatase PhoE